MQKAIRKEGLTDFQYRVYEAVRSVPQGRVATYKSIAVLIGCGSARAVGQALKKNPFAPEVPCHRVISSNLSIGGFRGSVRGKAVSEKRSMLRHEGVLFDKKGCLSDSEHLWP